MSAWDVLRRFLPYFRPHRRLLVLIIICLMFSSLLNVFTIVAFKPIVEVFFGVDEVVEQRHEATSPSVPPGDIAIETSSPQEEAEEKILDEMSENYGLARWLKAQYQALQEKKEQAREWFITKVREGKRFQILAVLSLVILAANFLRLLFTFGAKYLTSFVGLSIIRELKSVIYRHVLNLDMSFFASRSTGYLMARISSDVGGVRSAIMLFFSKVLQAPINLLFVFALLFYLNWVLTLCILVFIPITVMPIRYFGKKVRKLTRKERRKVADISSVMQEILSGIKIVKAFRMENYEFQNYDKQNWKHYRYLLRRRRTKDMASPAMEFLGTFAVVLVLLLGGYFIMRADAMAASEFVVYLYALSRVYGPVKQLEKANEDMQVGLAHAERVLEIIDTKPTVVEPAVPMELEKVKGELYFDNVSFGYTPDTLVLEDITLHVEAGKTLALVGPSGAGKSTLVSLIPRFYDPQNGVIKLDGVNIKDLSFDCLRGNIGIVSQESILFNDTIKNNIAYGRGDISEKEIIQAARLANAHDFIMRLPQGYNTLVGERGAKVSGGERQRITIARAILKNPPILILDEATSNLDSEAEALIQEALARLISNRTTFVIAHRLSTVMIADVIVVLQEGRIAEMGTHRELLEKNGLYAKLCRIQFHTEIPSGRV